MGFVVVRDIYRFFWVESVGFAGEGFGASVFYFLFFGWGDGFREG